MKAVAAVALAGAVLLSLPAAAQDGDRPPPPGELVMRPLGGLVPMPPAPGGVRPSARMLGLAEPREAPPAPPLAPPSAAEFSFRRGPTEIHVRCNDNEPVKACADAALVLMDKFASVTAGTPDAPPAGGAPAGDPPPAQ